MKPSSYSRPRFSGCRDALLTIVEVLREAVNLKLSWLIPLICVLFLIGFLLMIVGAAGPLAPFVYPLF